MKMLARLVATTALTLTALSACSSGGKPNEGTGGRATAQTTIRIGTAAESKGPARPVQGARQGGTVNVYNTNDFGHLDPQKSYAAGDALFQPLISRQLTT